MYEIIITRITVASGHDFILYLQENDLVGAFGWNCGISLAYVVISAFVIAVSTITYLVSLAYDIISAFVIAVSTMTYLVAHSNRINLANVALSTILIATPNTEVEHT